MYGTTWVGGISNAGTIFGVNKDGSGYSILHSFSYNGQDGAASSGLLLEGSDGALFGISENGGTLPWVDILGGGTVFKLNKDGTGFHLLHTFGHSAADGKRPVGGLIETSDGVLYGATYGGGPDLLELIVRFC